MRRPGGKSCFIVRRRAVAILLAAAGVVQAGIPAQAADVSGVAVAAAGRAVLIGVSCSSANDCMAVGTRSAGSPGSTGFPLAESWNGKAWAVKAIPHPKGAMNSNLYAVSCSAASACMAAGAYEDAAAPTGVPFTEAWNGRTWAVIIPPSPGGSDSSLNGVSCVSARACVAVGSTIIGGHNNAFSELWNGRAWTIKATPRPTGTTYSDLGDISCRSAVFCMATGDYQVGNSSKSRTLAEVWNGRAWVIRATPNPQDGVNGDGIPGVACSSPGACVAVGGYGTPDSQRSLTLAEVWNGRIWAIRATPNPKAGGGLSSVSCRAASDCMAVGGSGESGFFSEEWNGKAWTIRAVPHPRGAVFASMNSVSCAADDACVAVGDESSSSNAEMPVAEAWNGKAWTIKTVPL
jgi:hypothetical protein